MKNASLATTALAAALAFGTGSAVAQTTGTTNEAGQRGPAAAQPGMMQGRPMQGPGRMAGRGPGPRGMQAGRRGMMRPMMMRVMFVAIDTDGSGTLSLDEVQAFHGRMFSAADANDDGELEPGELRQFMTGRFQ